MISVAHMFAHNCFLRQHIPSAKLSMGCSLPMYPINGNSLGMFGGIVGNSQPENFPEEERCFFFGNHNPRLTICSSCHFNRLKGALQAIRHFQVHFVKMEFVGIHFADCFCMFYHSNLESFKSTLIWDVYLVLDGRNAA